MNEFMFATGIENSYPTIALPDGRTKRIDELGKTGHYKLWLEDFQLVKEMGIKYLRYGLPYYRTHTAPGRYDWDMADETLLALKDLGITPIIDLCHFGVPDWVGGFQNTDWAPHFAEYARAFAERYPWITLYTPVNEIFVCAKFSALYGWWNERETSERAFLNATRNMVKASLLAMREIIAVQPAAVFIQSESSEYTHTICGCEHTHERVDWENQMRFLALDLLYSHEVRGDVHAWLLDNGMAEDEYRWFMSHKLDTRCVMGNDYYTSNERILQHDGSLAHTGEVFGWYLVTREYYERYHKPLMHTETNIREEDNSIAWLWKQWQNVLRMRAEGIPVLGFTWYSLTHQVDWDTALREDNGRVNALGLYDLQRQIRPVGEAYRNLIEEFKWLPVVPNSNFFTLK